MKSLGMVLLIIGCCTAALGLVLMVSPRLPWLGHLPGDIHYQGRNTSFHFPVVTCIVASIVLTIILNVVMWLFRK